jgi:hypothetical protein
MNNCSKSRTLTIFLWFAFSSLDLIFNHHFGWINFSRSLALKLSFIFSSVVQNLVNMSSFRNDSFFRFSLSSCEKTEGPCRRRTFRCLLVWVEFRLEASVLQPQALLVSLFAVDVVLKKWRKIGNSNKNIFVYLNISI